MSCLEVFARPIGRCPSDSSAKMLSEQSKFDASRAPNMAFEQSDA